METRPELFTVGGVEVRRVKPRVYVREDEWQGYLRFNKPLNLSYMLKHEPFDELPNPYIPAPGHNHLPPTFIFGFPISRAYRELFKIALDEGLMPPEERDRPGSFVKTQLLVRGYINEKCGPKLGRNISGIAVRSVNTDYVLELKTNYRQCVPKDKIDEVMEVLRKYLPGTEPRWYLEADINLKCIRNAPMSIFRWSMPPGLSIEYSRVVAFNEDAPFSE